MPQHFLLSSRAKTLSIAQVMRLSDQEAEATFRRLRWPETKGKPVCGHCGGMDVYDCRCLDGAPSLPLPRLGAMTLVKRAPRS